MTPSSPDPGATPLLEARGLTKRFPGVLALRGVHLSLGRGEVLGIVGENGAGKSTLMKILAGVESPDAGEIVLDGRPVVLGSVREALSRGVALIHQELNLADNLDIAANIFLGREPRRGGFIDEGRMEREARALMARVGLGGSPRALVGGLSLGQRHLVEIAKALSASARVLIMDEPTSCLSPREAEALFQVVRELRAGGISVVYISHRLGEVRALCDRVLVLRDGENAGELGRDEVSHERLVRLMVGRDLSQFYPHVPHPPGEPVLEVSRLRTARHPEHALSFTVRAGEIVGVAGLLGAGRTSLLKAIFGVAPAAAGSIRVAGREVTLRTPRDAIAAGIGLVPEDRQQQGIILEMAVRANVSLPSLERTQRRGVLDRAGERRMSAQIVRELGVRTPSDVQPAQHLSGGNQQKVVIGKWLSMSPRVLLLDEPTRGIDVGAKHEIYQLMERLAAGGMATLFVSSDMEEVIGMSDRALVMHEGRIAGELGRAELSEEAIMQRATGSGVAA
ncbi:sugar ABC transporter ATP-binding protein [Sorangium sp. So ce1097]|uniref:sugar ABC transporter ATP-binding protein n=1 Tax=Sorangium sp. So ce1097 TaxID=3133330 RepID=UPI003F5F0D0E